MGCKPFTDSDYEELWRRILPNSYTQPIEDEGQGQGFDVPALQAEIWARFEDAANVSQQAYFLKPHSIQTAEEAKSGRKATTTVQITRAAPANGAINLPIGTLFDAAVTSSLGDPYPLGRFKLISALLFGDGVSGPLAAPLEAEFVGYTGNTREGTINAFSSLGKLTVPGVVALGTGGAAEKIVETPDPTESQDIFSSTLIGRFFRVTNDSPTFASENGLQIRQIVAFENSPRAIIFTPALDDLSDVGAAVLVEVEEYSELGFTVTQPDPSIGGRGDALAAIATDRRQGRVLGESDQAFRDRLCNLEDTISPGAIQRICDRIMGPCNLCCRLIETRDIDTMIGFVWDLHMYDYFEPAPPNPTNGLVQVIKVSDSEIVGQGIVWTGPGTSTRYFALGIERGNQGEFGFPYDATDVQAPLPANAWDNAFYDGSPIGFLSKVGQLHEAVDQARAAGIRFDLFIDPSACEPVPWVPAPVAP